MAITVTELEIKFEADTLNATVAIDSLDTALQNFSNTASAMLVERILERAFKATADAINDVLQTQIAYRQGLSELQNNTGATAAQMRDLDSAIQAVGSHGSAQLDDLSLGMEHITNYGFSAADSMTILNAAMMSASTTGSETNKTADLLSSTLHQFSLAGTEATNVANVLHQASLRGNTTWEEFAANSQRAVAAAASLRVPLTDVTAALSALTRAGFDAAEAQTQVLNMMVHMTHPTVAAREELARLTKMTGVDLVSDFSAAGLAGKGLMGVFDDLQTAFARAGISGANVTGELYSLIAAQRGGWGASVLLGQANDDLKATYEELTAAMQGRLNPVQQAYAVSMQNLGYQSNVLGNQIELLKIHLGDELEPSLHGVVGALSSVTTFLDQHAKAAVIALAGVLTALLIPALNLLAAVTIPRVLAALSLLSPVMFAIAAVAGVLVAGLTAWDAWGHQIDYTGLELNDLNGKLSETIRLSREAKEAAEAQSAVQITVNSGLTTTSNTLGGLTAVTNQNIFSNKEMRDSILDLNRVQRERVDDTREATDAEANLLKSMATTQAAMDQYEEELTNKVRSALRGFTSDISSAAQAVDTGGAGMANAMLRLFDAMGRELPDSAAVFQQQIQHIMDGVHDGSITSMDDMRTQIVDVLHAMQQSGDEALRIFADAALETLDNLHDQGVTKAGYIGADWVGALVEHIAAGMPAFADIIGAILKTADQQETMALIGGAMGRRFRIELLAEMSQGLQAAANNLSQLTFGLGGNIGAKIISDMAAQYSRAARSMAEDEGLIGAHIGKTIEQLQAEADAAAKRAEAEARAAAARARAEANRAAAAERRAAAEQLAETKGADAVIKELGRAMTATVSGTKTMAQAYDDLLPILTSKLPAGLEWLRANYDALLQQMTSDTPPSLEAIHNDFVEWNNRLLSSNNAAWRLLAQANIDTMQQMVDSVSEKGVKLADKTAESMLRAQVNVTKALEKMAESADATMPDFGDTITATLDLIKQAGDANMTGFVTDATAELQRLLDGKISIRDMHDFAVAELDDMRRHGDLTTRAMATAMLANLDRASAAMRQTFLQAEADVTKALDSIATQATKKGATTGDALIAFMDLARKAADANMPALASAINDALSRLDSGAATLSDFRTEALAILNDLAANGDAIMRAWASAMLRDIADADAALAADLRKTKEGVLSDLESLTELLTTPDYSPADAMARMLALAESASAAGMPDLANLILRWFAVIRDGGTLSMVQLSGAVQLLFADMAASGDAFGSMLEAKLTEHFEAIRRQAEETARATATALQGLVTSFGSIAQEIISGKSSVLDILKSMIPLIKQAIDSGMPDVANTIQRWLAVAAAGGEISMEELATAIGEWLRAAAASGSTELAVLAAQIEAMLRHAQAVAAATAALEQYQAALDGAKEHLAEVNAAVQAAQDVVNKYQQAVNNAQQALNEFVNAPLEGQKAMNDAMFANKMQAEELQYKINQLKLGGASEAELKPLLDALARLQLEGQQLQLQNSMTYDPMRKQLQDIANTTKEISFEDAIKGAKQAREDMLRYQERLAEATKNLDGWARAQKAAQEAVELAQKAYDDQKKALDDLNDTLLTQVDILREIALLLGQNVSKGVADGMDQSQDDLAKSADAAADTVKKTFTKNLHMESPSLVAVEWGHNIAQGLINGLGDMNSNVTHAADTTTDAVTTSFTTMLQDVASALQDEAESRTANGILYWWSDKTKGLLGMMDNVFEHSKGNYRAVLRLAFVGLMTDISNTIKENAPDVLSEWHAMLQAMYDDAADYVRRILAEFAKLPGGGTTTTTTQGNQGNTEQAFSGFSGTAGMFGGYAATTATAATYGGGGFTSYNVYVNGVHPIRDMKNPADWAEVASAIGTALQRRGISRHPSATPMQH